MRDKSSINSIYMVSSFGERNTIERHVFNKLQYNTRVIIPDAGEVVILQNGIAKKLRRIDGNIINPHKTSFLGRNEIDEREYTLYFIDGSRIDSTWGSYIVYDDPKVNGIRETVFIRATFVFRIEKGDLFVSCLSDRIPHYDRAYVKSKINATLDNIIKQEMSKALNKNGRAYVQEHLFECSNSLEQKINEIVLANIGVRIESLNLSYDEDTVHAGKRESLDWKIHTEKQLKGV